MRYVLFYFFVACSLQLVIPYFFSFDWYFFLIINMIMAYLAILLYGIQPRWIALVSFMSVALVWLTYSCIIDHANASVMSQRMAQLFNLGSGTALIIIQAIIGGLLSMLSGYVVWLWVPTPTLSSDTTGTQ